MAALFTNATIARVKGDHLIIESLRDELVIYDRRTHKAHLLDARATAIWNAAANGCSLDDLAVLVEGKTVEQRRATAQLGVLDLERAGLLVSDMVAMPRRGLLKALGTAAMPLVISILAPTTAAAQTLCSTSSGGDMSAQVSNLMTGACGGICGTNGPANFNCDSSCGGDLADGCDAGGNVCFCCSAMWDGTYCIP